MILTLWACVSPIVVPAAADLRFAPAGATLEQLEDGRALYVRKCSGCHDLRRPEAHSPDDWSEIVDRMSLKANLGFEDEAAIELYLRTESARIRAGAASG